MLLSLAFQDTDTRPAAKPEKVCRMMDPPIGSRLGRRKVCKTREEWQEADRDAVRALRDASANQRRD
ncbi:hypothetical protein ACFQ1E_00145 [Sphingomonas canadensis]|uniref:Uncharacterized protein n=1 Tax=Sphingomonas canadensis TaxID=1219257 RepID=A0ABW3H626_9SPHN|nr:hypothetical protein [Sphingomonas canadensis]MCW3835351.1 hypothetical protein [Sphingomonas canadensis]